MKYYKIKSGVEDIKKDENKQTSHFQIKAYFEAGDTLDIISPFHKVGKIKVKELSGNPFFVLQPQYRVDVPTGMQFTISARRQLIITSNKKMTKEYGVAILGGVEIVNYYDKDEIKICLYNFSDTPVNIFSGDVIGIGIEMASYDYGIVKSDHSMHRKYIDENNNELTDDDDEDLELSDDFFEPVNKQPIEDEYVAALFDNTSNLFDKIELPEDDLSEAVADQSVVEKQPAKRGRKSTKQ